MTSPLARLIPKSSRARIYIYAVVAFLLLTFATTSVSMVIVNQMKNRLVDQAKEVIKRSGEQLGDSIGSFLAQEGVEDIDDLDEMGRGTIVEMVKRYAQTHTSLTLFTLIDENGTAVYVDRSQNVIGRLVDEPTPLEDLPSGLDPLNPTLPPLIGEEEQVEVPIALGPGHSGLRLTYRVSLQRIASGLKDTSRAITRVSWILVGLVLLLTLAGISSLARVLSHLVAVNDEAHRLDRLAYVGTLAAGLAHEIRNPLNAMSINLDLVGEDLGTDSSADPATRGLVDGIKGQIVHLNKIVENFLTYARPMRRTDEVVDLGLAMREAAMALGPEMESRGIRCEIGDLPDGAMVAVDPTALHQALTNVLLNAAQAMDKPERVITIHGHAEASRATLIVEDNGKGIPPDQLESIFEVFYSTKSGGSGLGLPTAKRAIDDAGGSIAVESVAAQGTTVTITLPRDRRRRR
ncbi:HAMP domain-containing histidine kinase [Candidatus Sumerlaeota bacterium]|nr:HAMP domain-containing histidine kinase [Candidatus Sumerlaeota bacterium]